MDRLGIYVYIEIDRYEPGETSVNMDRDDILDILHNVRRDDIIDFADIDDVTVNLVK
jgi:hypothetical protein